MSKFEVPVIKGCDGLNFVEDKICVEKLLESYPATYLPYKSSQFLENSNCCINFLFNARGLKLGHFEIHCMLFPFLAFFKL